MLVLMRIWRVSHVSSINNLCLSSVNHDESIWPVISRTFADHVLQKTAIPFLPLNRIAYIQLCCDMKLCFGTAITASSDWKYFVILSDIVSQQAQNICITFVQRRTNVEDVGSTLYKCYVLCLLGHQFHRFKTSVNTTTEITLPVLCRCLGVSNNPYTALFASIYFSKAFDYINRVYLL